MARGTKRAEPAVKMMVMRAEFRPNSAKVYRPRNDLLELLAANRAYPTNAAPGATKVRQQAK
ncbi:MAG: hypothetical protein ABJG73_10530 [Tateyamaria sp.]|uniref:hypothetical protein n=1 Tax=Tateyamaria sp. TaxID=1929288 RepID=UPI00329F8B9D